VELVREARVLAAEEGTSYSCLRFRGGCTLGKWLVVREGTIFSSWKGERKPVAQTDPAAIGDDDGLVAEGNTGVALIHPNSPQARASRLVYEGR
jgi:hypothetical protein